MMEEKKSLGMQPEETGKAVPVTPHDEEAPMPVWDEGVPSEKPAETEGEPQSEPVQAPWQAVSQPPVPPPPVSENPDAPKKRPGRGQRRFLWGTGILAGLLIALYIGYTAAVLIQGGDTGLSAEGSAVIVDDGESSDGGFEFDWDNGEPEQSQPDDTQLEQPQHMAPSVSYRDQAIDLESRDGKEELTNNEVYKKLTNSVVGIAARYEVASGVYTVSQGSGIIASEDGYIITNAHVIGETRTAEVVVYLADGTTYGAVVIGYDRMTDLAALKIDATGLTPAEFGDSDELEVGDPVLALGSPGGLDFQNTLTNGIVSALDREVSGRSGTYIQTNAAINPGNSGGPLVNQYGQVIGINSSKIMATGYEGMGFAIPTRSAQTILHDLIACGYVQGRPRLGITGRTVEQNGYSPAGFQIESVGEDSGFAKVGTKKNDIITAVNGETVTSLEEVQAIIFEFDPGDTVTITLYRPSPRGGEGQYLDVEVELLADTGETQQ